MEAKERAEKLVGRELSVEGTEDGKHVVLYMNFMTTPPPKGDSPEEAYSLFSLWYEDLLSKKGEELSPPQ